MYTTKVTIIFAVAITIASVGMIPISSSAIAQSSQTSQSMSGSFAEISTVQEGDTITITITRAEGAPEGEGEIPEVPEGPIIIVPDPSGEGNGTIIVPGNETTATPGVEGGGAGNVTVVEPDGNVTQVPPPTNVTVIQNDTVVIVAPPNQTVTETPSNVTVIDPPTPPAPEPCGCPPGVSGGAPDIQLPMNATSPVLSNNTNITVLEEQPPSEANGGNGDNGNGDDGG